MINSYLSKYPNNLKKFIVDKYNKDSILKKFIDCCVKMNIFLYEKNNNFFNFIGYENLLKKMFDLKTIYLKNFGVKIIKKISENIKTSTYELDRTYIKLKKK